MQEQTCKNDRIKPIKTGQHLIARGTVFLMFGQASTVIGGLLIHVIGSRVLSPKQYSQFVLAFSVTIVLQLLLTTGFPKAFSFLTSKYPNNAWYIIKRGCLLIFALSILLFTFYAFTCLWIGDFNFRGTEGMMVIAAFVLPPIALFFSVLGAINGLQLFLLESVATSVYYFLRAILIAALFVVMRSVAWGLVGNTLSAIISFIFVIYLARRHIKERDEGLPVNIFVSMKEFALPTTIYGILMACLMSLDVWLANWLLTSNEGEAIFSCAYTISRLFFYGSFALSNAIFSPMVQAISISNQEKIRDILSKAFLFVEFTVLPVTVGIIFYPDLLIRILYPEVFLNASLFLPILASARFFVSLLLIVTAWFLAAQRLRKCIFYAFGGCLLVMLNGYLGFKWAHTIGLASGYAIGCVLVTVAAMADLSLYVKISIWNRRNLTSLVVASGLCGIVYWLIKSVSGEEPIFIIRLVGFIAIILIYPAVAFAFGAIESKDFHFIGSFMIKD